MKHGWLGAATRSAKLTAVDKVVALTLWEHAKTSGIDVFPAQSSIARMAGISVSSVKTSLATLERHGWITRDGTQPSGRGRPVVRYRLSRPTE